MDVLELIARSEWPIVVGGALWFLRAPLRGLAEKLNPTKIDAWGFKAEFDKGLNKVEALTPATSPLESAAPILVETLRTLQKAPPERLPEITSGTHQQDQLGLEQKPADLQKLLSTVVAALAGSPTTGAAASSTGVSATPEMIVLEAWRRLEATMRKLSVDREGGTVAPVSRPHRWRIEEAARILELNDDEIESLRVLRNLRNKIAHSDEVAIDWYEATRFKDAADGILMRIVGNEAMRQRSAEQSSQ